MVKRGEQRLPVIGNVEQNDRFSMQPQLRPAQHLAQLIQRAVPSRQRDKGIRQLGHFVLALMHIADDMQLRQAAMRHFPIHKLLWDHANRLAASS